MKLEWAANERHDSRIPSNRTLALFDPLVDAGRSASSATARGGAFSSCALSVSAAGVASVRAQERRRMKFKADGVGGE
jgi:hypothetical protein